jgi:uncharacterized LabA/DUF88 family protein
LTGNAPDEQRIALFIDFENIAIGVRDAHYRRFDINLVLERLVEKGKILTKRAYADWGRYGEYRRSFHEAAVELIEVPQKSVGGKNSADIRLVVDAMDMSFQKEHIDCFCIASGDSDFSPLVSKLKENDKYVIGLGVKNSTSDLLMENCDEFIFYEDLVRRQEKPAVVIPNIPEKLQEAFSILVDSVVALQLENKGALWGSMVKETMKRKKPSFNETYYGFRSFSNLLEDAQRRGVVTLRRDQKSGSYIVEDLGAATRGDGSTAPARGTDSEPLLTGTAATSTPSADPSLGTTNGNGGGARSEIRLDRRPAPGAAPSGTVNGASVPVVPASSPEDALVGGEGEGPEGEAPTRPRRRRGGRGRGRGRDGRDAVERDSRPDLEARSDELPLPALQEDSRPSIPAPADAATAYAQEGERAGPESESAASAPRTALEPRPAPPVAPVDPSKASFSLLGWLKGGG